jgi:hypothetical protein
MTEGLLPVFGLSDLLTLVLLINIVAEEVSIEDPDTLNRQGFR